MRRLHLFELEDFAWLPAPIRDGGTDLLDLMFDRMRFYDAVAPRVVELLRSTGKTRLVDLCSGGGGGTLQMRKLLRASGSDAELVMSDLHPNATAIARIAGLGDPKTRYRAEPVDALSGGGEESGVRTMSGALHHFPPDAVRSLVAGIVARGEPLAFFDVAASPAIRKAPIVVLPVAMALNCVMLFLVSLFITPLVRPFSIVRLLLTYPLPLIPTLFAWDGTVSALRAYTPDELLDIARSVPGADRYAWDSAVKGSALYLTGQPR
jgi:hypothetical protein